jgi:hypothetical protein
VEFSRDTTMHLTVLKYSDERDAVRIANDSDYGLAGSVWTADTAHGLQIAEAVRTGSYGINMYDLDIASPFGGFKQSGIGREFAAEGLRVRRAAIDGERRRLAAIGATARGGSTMTADASPRVQPVPVVPVVDAVRAPACASISRRWSPYRPTFSK